MSTFSWKHRALACALAGSTAIAVVCSASAAPVLTGTVAVKQALPSDVQDVRWGWGGGAFFGGLVAGGLIGAAIASPYYYGGYGGYGGYGYGYPAYGYGYGYGYAPSAYGYSYPYVSYGYSSPYVGGYYGGGYYGGGGGYYGGWRGYGVRGYGVRGYGVRGAWAHAGYRGHRR